MRWRLKNLRQDKRGATVVEFALIAPVFFFMVLGIVEYSIYYFRTSHLKHVLYEASRNLQTGEVQAASDPQAHFRDAYCDDAGWLTDCSQIFFDVRNYSSLGEIAWPEATFDEDGVPEDFVFDPGGPDQLTVLRVATPYRFFTPMMARIFQPDGSAAIIVGYTVAKNEPF